MKTRVLTFFTLAIFAMVKKLVVVGVESYVSFKHHKSYLASLLPYAKIVASCGIIADILFSGLIFYYLKSS